MGIVGLSGSGYVPAYGVQEVQKRIERVGDFPLGEQRSIPIHQEHEPVGAQFVQPPEWRTDQHGPQGYHGPRFESYSGQRALTDHAPPPAAPAERGYSRAFENFVAADGDEEDVVGLVAYALFKQAVREEAASGAVVAGDARNPSATTVKTYRAAAEQLLTGIVDRALDAATPDIQQSAVLSAIENAAGQVKSHVTERTGFGSALLTNLLAWVLTLAIAALVLILAARPSVEQTVAKAVDRVGVSQPASPGNGQ